MREVVGLDQTRENVVALVEMAHPEQRLWVGFLRDEGLEVGEFGRNVGAQDLGGAGPRLLEQVLSVSWTVGQSGQSSPRQAT